MKSDTEVTSPSTRWISSPGVCRRWKPWLRPEHVPGQPEADAVGRVPRRDRGHPGDGHVDQLGGHGHDQEQHGQPGQLAGRGARGRPIDDARARSTDPSGSGPNRRRRARRGRPNARRRVGAGPRGRANERLQGTSERFFPVRGPPRLSFSIRSVAIFQRRHLALSSSGDSIAPRPRSASRVRSRSRQHLSPFERGPLCPSQKTTPSCSKARFSNLSPTQCSGLNSRTATRCWRTSREKCGCTTSESSLATRCKWSSPPTTSPAVASRIDTNNQNPATKPSEESS